MAKKVFFYAFLLGAMVLLISGGIFFGLQYRQTMDDAYETLRGEASYVESGVKIGGIEYLKSLDNTNRITWIGADGSVLYDSEYPDLTANQGDFKEVRQALETGSGSGIRRSSSGRTQTMYYGLLCEDGTVVRLSRPVSVVRHAFAVFSLMISVTVLVLILISALIAFRIAKTIAEPINEMDLDDLPHSNPYPELRLLVERFEEQKEEIASQAVEREQLRRETMEQQAQEQERMRREFSANVSHELKTPLTSINGFAELMRSGLCDEEKMIEFAGDIYRESQRLIALVNDIIRISELDEGAIHTTTEKVDIVKAAQDTIDILQPSADKRGISISLQAPSGEDGSRLPVRVVGSDYLIREMFYNLCDNAVKYNHDGGKIHVTIREDDDNAVISFADTGIGIPESEQDRVFERFYRVDKSHSRTLGGTGLGLSIVKHAAQVQNASVEMKSEPDIGTTITVYFPFDREETDIDAHPEGGDALMNDQS